ncbi:MAG: J domain-containing protein, partial [Deltaproteobacteria bacterium]|nr:J domain-containing protein [Deltaproteobacteria bacterium]
MSPEEANARALLLEMQTRLSESPHIALGLPRNASATEIRSAFLQLTKTFHPARFGRMSTEIQRLSNEVFLLLRAAHDALAKPKPTGRANSTTATPTTKTVTRPFGVPITPTTRPGVPTTGKPPTETPTPPVRQTAQMPVVKPGATPPP